MRRRGDDPVFMKLADVDDLLRGMAQFSKEKQKLQALFDDKNSVFSYASRPGRLVLDSGSEITLEECDNLLSTAPRLMSDVDRLLERLSGSAEDVDALLRVIETAGLIGRFMGAHPTQNKVEMKKRRDKRVPWWHKPAITRAAEIRMKHPNPKKYGDLQIADDVYQDFKDKSGGPPSSEAVRAVLKRDKKRKSKLDD